MKEMVTKIVIKTEVPDEGIPDYVVERYKEEMHALIEGNTRDVISVMVTVKIT